MGDFTKLLTTRLGKPAPTEVIDIQITPLKPGDVIDAKGRFDGFCNRTACQKPPARWWHRSNRAYYCDECAALLNRIHARDAHEIYGTDLLVEHQAPGVEKQRGHYTGLDR